MDETASFKDSRAACLSRELMWLCRPRTGTDQRAKGVGLDLRLILSWNITEFVRVGEGEIGPRPY